MRAVSGVAHVHLHNFSEAEETLQDTLRLCGDSEIASCGDLLQARGVLATEQNQADLAEKMYKLSLAFARSHKDPYLASTSMLNLGAQSLELGHFDEAIDRSQAARDAAIVADAKVLAFVAQGNIGWAYYRLGDAERALRLALESEKAFAELEDVFDQGNELTNIGYVYMDQGKFDLAAQSFEKALLLARGIKAKGDIHNALRVLARLSLQTGDLNKASEYAEQALQESEMRSDQLYPLLIQGEIAGRRGDVAVAEETFHEIEQDAACPVFLRWEAEHSLARLYEAQNDVIRADRQYRAALATFEAARYEVRHEDFQLSFLTNASRIYEAYIHFLVSRGLTNEALRWADYNRARSLAESLGLTTRHTSSQPPPLTAQATARRDGRPMLFYALGEKQSYLWAITPRKVSLFTLPPRSIIDATVRRYREAMSGEPVTFESARQDGTLLYRMLVEPARSLLPENGRVAIIPDGSLNNLNFETLLVDGPRPHYWIEDVTITNASSLRLLGNEQRSPAHLDRRLLLIGNSVAPNPRYPELPKAASQIEGVARHFADGQKVVLTREQATPAAYLASTLEKFSHVHFVAHGTASRLIPLDSAIVLSRSTQQHDSFKLYARDIIRHPLRADLVTISSCYGAEGREYPGEGLVGLSWAFLKAGAHNVVAALWEATDASTERLMSKFYDELDQGIAVDSALRNAKLALLGDPSYRDPFYWATFQLYAGSYRSTASARSSISSVAASAVTTESLRTSPSTGCCRTIPRP